MKKIIIAVTGASAQQIAERTIQLLLLKHHHVNLILSKGAYQVWKSEYNINIPLDPIKQSEFWRNRLGTDSGNLECFKWNDISAPFASGSYFVDGMFIIPCTMGTLGRISAGLANNLIERSADVQLKESRPLILVPRESPFNLIHLRNMTTLVESGAKIIPPIPAWYSQPKSIEELIDFMVVRIFDTIHLDLKDIKRWKS